ncbi:MAG: autotransporter outer membrane beta-barrel domain-containing protein [Chthoniobacter sp.]|uniref:autotransporter outer membrane beta-barrel domain-containing protein n=1 Tax=Chthoniobacter sp. TaxID=2510640 RepID=UPI0032A1C0E0
MKSLRRTVPILAGAVSLLLATPVPSAQAANKRWTENTGTPVWATLLLNNWTGILSPTRIDTAIFGERFTPSPLDAFYRVRTDGSEVLLVKVLPAVPGPIAADLVFQNDWKLTEPTRGLVGFFAAPLTLTGGFVTVTGAHTAIIDADVIMASNQLTKLGSGTLLLEREVRGSVVVQEGVLGGNFTTTGNLTNQATLSPGNSPGTITVRRNYQQTATGTLALEIASPTSYDHLLVNGSAQLHGNLDVALLNGYRPKKGQKFTFLSAGGGVSGEFDKVNAPVWDLLTLRPFYSGDSVALKAVVASFDALPDLTSNQHAVAYNLDRVISDPHATKLIHYLYSKDLNELPGFYDKIAPEELTSIFAIGTSLATVQSLNIQRRTDDIRSGSNGFSSQRFAMNGSAPNYSGTFNIASGVAGPNGHAGKESKEDYPPVAIPAENNRWGTFLSGTGEWVSVGNTDNARGYDLNSGGFTLGIDYKVTPNFAIGLAAGYTGTTADLVDRGRVWVNGGKIGLYATFFQNEQAAAAPTMSKDSSKDSSKEAPAPAPSIAKGFYADVAVFGGYNSYDTRRSALQGEARGDTDGGELNALFGMGYDIKKGNLTFGPTASFNYTYIGTSEFAEHGSLAPLNIHGGKGESLRTALGFKASYDWKVGGILIKPEIRAAWQHEYGDAAYALDSSFANGAGNSFLVNGPQLGRDSVLLGAGFAIQCSERTSTYFYYDGELGRKNYQSTNVTGGFRYAF